MLEQAATKDKLFYQQFPSKDSHPMLHDGRTAYHEELQAYCAIGIKRSNVESIVDESEEGIFNWTADSKKSLNNTSRNATIRKEKKIELVEYLLEHVFELLLSKENDVSTSPGFERYLLQKKKVKAISSK